MKIAVIGYSGSGKSTLARKLHGTYQIPVLHLDRVHHMPGWQERELHREQQIVQDFLEQNSAWVIDGNYSKLSFERRMEEADQIIMLLFPPLTCFLRAFRRYLTFRNRTRPDMAEGCQEKFDWEFVKWILWEGRSKGAKARYAAIAAKYPHKTVILKHQRQLQAFTDSICVQKKQEA